MPVFYHYNDLPNFSHPVVTIGSFDGVHYGHRAILDEVVKAAKLLNGESILITFEPHPRKIIQPDFPLGLLTSLEEKTTLLLDVGIDNIIVVPFTRDFSMLSATEYVQDFLVKNFNPKKIVIGYDHRFGHSREGNIGLLKTICPPEIIVEEIPEQLIKDASVSSTKIRQALLDGKVEAAAAMLGRDYSYTATVVHGNKIGRTIGYPTANLQPVYPDILIPGIGIYAVMVSYAGAIYKGMMSIGYRPTVTDEKNITCEVNILDFEEDIYGKHLTIYFKKYLRGEEKFDSLDALKQQIANDEKAARTALA